MVLKKQTVWLLTMLSLIVVLSVYYVTSPEQIPGEEVALVGEENQDISAEIEQVTDGTNEVVVNMADELEKATLETVPDANEMPAPNADGSVISNISSNDAFATIRMDLQASRDRMAEELTQIVASAETSAEMKSEAHDKSMELQRLAQNEATLETLIKAKGYDDALVMAEEDQVRVIVQTEELSKAEANEIMHMTFNQLGQGLNVAVSHTVSAQ
ncbi:SpoIIIAH-like family protein [Halalkalibacter nanhaiisediminis]|uniref:Stage III sporulation protein AH n=1 Tax=Halalkalibacter nanhaiisediminis TaxID=688079 RepID=A0A562QGS9_9BACI|nr:SpoIIIAH-like family protein [Halalkalibacter nanhaiisediminis]TWI55954.1 stage III sporulation protein AH [Halalkalibacter nanhaiisediminis]